MPRVVASEFKALKRCRLVHLSQHGRAHLQHLHFDHPLSELDIHERFQEENFKQLLQYKTRLSYVQHHRSGHQIVQARKQMFGGFFVYLVFCFVFGFLSFF